MEWDPAWDKYMDKLWRPKNNTPVEIREKIFLHKWSKLPSYQTIEYFGGFNTVHSPLHLRCKLDGYEWKNMSAKSLIHGQGCPMCVGRARWTKERYDEAMRHLENLEMLEYPKDMKIKLKAKFRCSKGHEFIGSAYSYITKRASCPKCAPNARLTDEIVKARLKERHGNDIELVGSYSSKDKGRITVKCNKCGFIWKTSQYHIALGTTGCPNESLGNKDLVYLLQWENSSYYKIGVTSSVDTLIARIKKVHPSKVSLMEFWYTDSRAFETEQEIHNILKGFRIDYFQEARTGNTEFFDFSDVEDPVELIDSLIDTEGAQ